MIESYIRPSYQHFCVDKFCDWLATKSITPLHITICATLTGVLAAVTIIAQYSWLAVLLLLISGYCDSLDGSLARRLQQTSAFGTVMDLSSDRLVEFVIILALFLVAPQSRALLSMLMLGATLLCITSFLAVGIFSENNGDKSFHYSPGLIERAEAFVFFIVMIVWPTSFNVMASIFTLLVLLTAVLRLYEFGRQAQ